MAWQWRRFLFALEKTAQGLKKGQKEENMWADSFPIMCLFFTISLKDAQEMASGES